MVANQALEIRVNFVVQDTLVRLSFDAVRIRLHERHVMKGYLCPETYELGHQVVLACEKHHVPLLQLAWFQQEWLFFGRPSVFPKDPVLFGCACEGSEQNASRASIFFLVGNEWDRIHGGRSRHHDNVVWY